MLLSICYVFVVHLALLLYTTFSLTFCFNIFFVYCSLILRNIIGELRPRSALTEEVGLHVRGKLVPPSSSRGGASRGLRCACSRRYTHRDSARRTDSRGVRTHGLRGPWVPDGRLEGVRGHWHLDAASRLVDLASRCGISRSGSERLAAGMSGPFFIFTLLLTFTCISFVFESYHLHFVECCILHVSVHVGWRYHLQYGLCSMYAGEAYAQSRWRR